MKFSARILKNHTEREFNTLALEIFLFQYDRNSVYREFVRSLGLDPFSIKDYRKIPFLPVSFFKTHRIYSAADPPEITFLSSGTTGMERSRHEVADLNLYRRTLTAGFKIFLGEPEQYRIFSFTPSPQEAPNSSLAFMMNELITLSGDGSFEDAATFDTRRLERHDKPVMIFGITYALLDLIERSPVSIPELIVVETGGMKGRRQEMIREELHDRLKSGFGVDRIRSEYGMSELMSQAWSMGEGLYLTPPWMRIFIRDANDPLTLLDKGKTGGISIIDLANLNSCSFIATQDLGKVNEDGTFEVSGRFDDSDIRGCSLLAT